MEKVVTYVGNSAAIILDRTICEIMGIEPGSMVRLSFQGTRLVIERTGHAKAEKPRKRPAPKPRTVTDSKESIVEPALDGEDYSLTTLIRDHVDVVMWCIQWGLAPDDAVSVDPRMPDATFRTVVVRLRRVLDGQPGPADVVVGRRLRFLWNEWHERAEWTKLVDEAIERYPWPEPRSADMSTGSGADAVTAPPSG